jgi:hypothetical protein
MKTRILAAAAAAFIAFAPAGAKGTAGNAAGTTANAAAANASAPAGNAAADMVALPADTGNAAPPASMGNVDDADTAAVPPPPPPPPHGFPWGVLGLIGLVGLLPLFRKGGER